MKARAPRWIVGAVVPAVAGLTVGWGPVPVAGAEVVTRPAAADGPRAAPVVRAGDSARAGVASRGDFAGLVRIEGGRRLYLECRGRGTPTVILESGGGDGADVWSFRPPGSRQTPVLPAVARYTRVCAYDRPSTSLASGPSRSDPVRLPRPASQIVADLHALLRAARLPGPYVLVGHSMGGLISRLYAGTYPRQVAGFVSVDAAHELLYDAFQALLTPGEAQPPGAELNVVATAAAMRRARVENPLRPMPMVVLEHSRNRQRFPSPFGYPATYPIAALERAHQAAQEDLATLVPGARHVIASRSGHNIHLDQPALVVRAIRQVVTAVRLDANLCRAPRAAASHR